MKLNFLYKSVLTGALAALLVLSALAQKERNAGALG